MKIELASKYGFCYGVKRAIEIAEKHQNSFTYGPLIHNKDEINRLQEGFNIGLVEKIEDTACIDTSFPNFFDILNQITTVRN